MSGPAFYDAAAVERLLDYRGCIAAMRDAMTRLSIDGRAQPLRQVTPIADGLVFGVMPGSLVAGGIFGAKLVSVGADGTVAGRTRHQGSVVVFDVATGAVTCIADAEAVTTIRTAAASAAATDVLARDDARTLAILGTGRQAASHARALTLVRRFERIVLWGRSAASAAVLARALSSELGVSVDVAPDARAAAATADVICTVSGAAEPILTGASVRPGTHVNLVGSSVLGPVEVDTALVAAARYIADYRPGVLAQAAELAVARDAGAVTDAHVVGEIGAVFAGTLTGRERADQITIYKSLGHVVQDLAASAYVHRRALAEGCPA